MENEVTKNHLKRESVSPRKSEKIGRVVTRKRMSAQHVRLCVHNMCDYERYFYKSAGGQKIF